MTSYRTIADWQAAYAQGAAPEALLPALREQLAARGAPVYLHVGSAESLQAQLTALQARRAALGAQAAAALPLFGVPFVVKDNIDVAGEPTSAACPAFTRTAGQHATAVQVRFKILRQSQNWHVNTRLMCILMQYKH